MKRVILFFFMFCIYNNAEDNFITNLVNKIIFAGSNNARDIAKEIKINFSSPIAQLMFIDKKNFSTKTIKKLSLEEVQNGIYDNIPCILLSQEKHHLTKKINKNLIVYFGGNGETIYSSHGYDIFDIVKQEADMILVGYPGYACDKTKPSADNFYEYTKITAHCLDDYLSKIYNKIIIIGWSIGCAAAIDTVICTKESTIYHLALINGFKNIKHCVKHYISANMQWAEGFSDNIISAINNDFNNKKRIKNIKTPITIIYTTTDNIVDNKDSKVLYNSATRCKNKVLKQINGDHCNWNCELVCKIINLHINNKKLEIEKI